MDQVFSAEELPKPIHLSRRQRNLLLLTAAASSSCGLAVELLLGTLASYLVGNQALSYGVAVGGFLAAMGLGAYLSRFVATSGSDRNQQQQLQTTFIWIELLIAPLSAFIPLGLFALFVIDGPFWIALFLATLVLGTLAGLELPVLTRLLEQDEGLKDALAGVLALDYVGALLGSLALPIVLLPLLGMFPAAMVIGAIPAFMVVALAIAFPKLRKWGRIGLILGIGLLILVPFTVPLGDRLENTLYKAPVITRIQSPYQRIVLTRQGSDLRLFLDGDLQFSSYDEYRYHEALVHPAMSANQALRQEAGGEGDREDREDRGEISFGSTQVSQSVSGSTEASPNVRRGEQNSPTPQSAIVRLRLTNVSNPQSPPSPSSPPSSSPSSRQVLILGAGDGLALREVLKWQDVKRVVLIDLDKAVVNLARKHPFLVQTNAAAYADPRVEVIQGDAFIAVPSLQELFDVIIADFPDPDRDAIAKLYAQGFYQRLLSRLAPDGVLVTQASSPFFAPKAFACVAATVESVGLKTYPYVVDVPSFGLWGFVMAVRSPIQREQMQLPIATRFLDVPTMQNLFDLPKDIQLGNVEINRLSQPVIVRYQADPRWAAYD
ncbi:MAG: spermidine synthase [Oscillatoriales cyanobacterium C42_A2020_001]|nr:spermidine synthase [Leptolyngbyaceae cyanobacterium C42_A2020_001]